MSEYKYIAEELRREIENFLFGLGLLCRVFSRGKDEYSLARKLSGAPGKYSIGSKMIQDIVGIRVVLYFSEDIEIVKNLLCSKYQFDEQSSTIDMPTTDQFSVSRFNLIYAIPAEYLSVMNRSIGNRPIDKTFEVQLRSMLSEGWHEVEHDLRYKSKEHWEGQSDLSRALNGIMATIETSEWSMRRVFDELAYRHYKEKKWDAMLHSKLRMRLSPTLSTALKGLFDDDLDCAKEFFRIDRAVVFREFAELKPRLPLNLDNVVYVWNCCVIKHKAILEITPTLIKEAFN